MLNYEKLIAFNPTIYSEVINRLGQKVQFVEHPTKGDESEVIAVFPEFKKAFYTDFFELGEIDVVGGEYEVLLVDGELVHGFEVN
jgi:hypothetical protein